MEDVAMKSTTRSFFLGILSVFSFGRVRLFDSEEIDIETDLKEFQPFASDADAIRYDFEKIGGDIYTAIRKYESKPQ